ncbi:MAG: MerR family transcriptional regulator [Oscillospiraceae bacterium]|nr:MerR family transcriptional regulator [Oscillospiraceae bacterium]
MTTYSTSQIAKRAGLHSNTVRLYEEWGLIQKPERKKNGYRVFTDVHIKQFELARKALQIEVLQTALWACWWCWNSRCYS